MNRDEREKFLKKLGFALSEFAKEDPYAVETYEQFKEFKSDYEKMDAEFPVFNEEYAHEYLDRLGIPRTVDDGRNDPFLTFRERMDILINDCKYATDQDLLYPWKLFSSQMQTIYLKEYGEHQDWFKRLVEDAEKNLIKAWMQYEAIPTKFGLISIANACLVLFYNWKNSLENEDKFKKDES